MITRFLLIATISAVFLTFDVEEAEAFWWKKSAPPQSISSTYWKIDVENDRPAEFQDEMVVIFNHPSSHYDHSKTALHGTLSLAGWARNNAIRSFLLLGRTHSILESPDSQPEADPESYYLRSADVDFTIRSDSGSHSLRFPNLKRAFVAGGYLSLCLCEAIRDLIDGTNKDLEIVFVPEAVFEAPVYKLPAISKMKPIELRKLEDHFLSKALRFREEDLCSQNPQRKKTNLSRFSKILFEDKPILLNDKGKHILRLKFGR